MDSKLNQGRSFQTAYVFSDRTGHRPATLAPYQHDPFTFPLTFGRAVQFDSAGVAQSGQANIGVPAATVKLDVVPYSATVGVDLASDGNCDRTFAFDWQTWADSTH
jgi:hypothetical protein